MSTARVIFGFVALGTMIGATAWGVVFPELAWIAVAFLAGLDIKAVVELLSKNLKK